MLEQRYGKHWEFLACRDTTSAIASTDSAWAVAGCKFMLICYQDHEWDVARGMQNALLSQACALGEMKRQAWPAGS